MVANVCRLLPLTCLAPDIVEAIVDERQPKGLRLAEMLGNGPLAWNRQRRVWLPPGALRRRPAWNRSRTASGPTREIEWLVSAGSAAALACQEGWIR